MTVVEIFTLCIKQKSLILFQYSIQCLVVRGSISIEFSDQCLAKRIVVLDKVPFKSMEGLADHFNVAMVTYITDIYQVRILIGESAQISKTNIRVIVAVIVSPLKTCV